jgi:uncharacterized protein YbjT (DUF2867 family)
MRLLVVGGSGFLGGYVLTAAAARGHQVTGLARSQEGAARVAARGATPLAGDIGHASGLDTAFASAGCEALVCLASLGTGLAPAIVAAAEEAGIRRAVFVSTTAVTTTLDAPSKRIRLAAEQQIRGSGLDWTILRPTMIYGAPGDRNLSRLLVLLRRVPVLPVPAVGGRLHQPVHVADAADAVIAAVERPLAAGHRYDVAGPEPLEFAELLRACAAAAGSATRFVPVPLPPLIAMARAYQRLSRHPRIKAEQLRRLGEDKAFAIDQAVSDLGYRPRPFRDGIQAEATALGLAS